MRGVLESHQLSKGRSPLLLSLHARAHLGLVKDLKNGIISVNGKRLKVFRCMHTGLMMLAITPQQLVQSLEPTMPQKIPKCHRKFRVALTAFDTPMERLDTAERGYQAQTAEGIHRALDNIIGDLKSREFLLVTGGDRFEDRLAQHIDSDFPVKYINAKSLWDPDQDPSLRGHVGRHPAILNGLKRDQRGLDRILREVDAFVERRDKGVLDVRCKSGCHRSVGGSMLIHRHPVSKGFTCVVIHSHSPEWCEMSRGGRCTLCGPLFGDTTVTLTPAHTMNVHTPRAVRGDADDHAPWRSSDRSTAPPPPPPTREESIHSSSAKACPRSRPSSSSRPPKASDAVVSRKSKPVPSTAMTSPVRPVPDFDDGDSDEDKDDKKVEEKKDEEVEEVEVEEPDVPADENSSGSQEILHALKKLTEAVTSL